MLIHLLFVTDTGHLHIFCLRNGVLPATTPLAYHVTPLTNEESIVDEVVIDQRIYIYIGNTPMITSQIKFEMIVWRLMKGLARN